MSEIASAQPQRSPYLARCGACGHVWAAFWAPFNAARIGRFRFICPWCGHGPKGVFMASAADAAAFATAPPGQPLFTSRS